MKQSAVVLRELYNYLHVRYDTLIRDIIGAMPHRIDDYYDRHAARLQDLKSQMEYIPRQLDSFEELLVDHSETRECIFRRLADAENVVRLYENWRNLPGFITQGYRRRLSEGQKIT